MPPNSHIMTSLHMTFVPIARLLLTGLLIALVWTVLPERLDVALGQIQTSYQKMAGDYSITIKLVPHGNDNGTVEMEISSNGAVMGTLHSAYNYDFFANQPAGWMRRTWIDGDWQLDLLLLPSENDQIYFVSSINGQLYQR